MLSVVNWTVLREEKFFNICVNCLMSCLVRTSLSAITQVSKVILWLYFFRDNLIWGLLVFNKLPFKAAHIQILFLQLYMCCVAHYASAHLCALEDIWSSFWISMTVHLHMKRLVDLWSQKLSRQSPILRFAVIPSFLCW